MATVQALWGVDEWSGGHPSEHPLEVVSPAPSSGREAGTCLDDSFSETQLDCRLALTPFHLWPKPHREPVLSSCLRSPAPLSQFHVVLE